MKARAPDWVAASQERGDCELGIGAEGNETDMKVNCAALKKLLDEGWRITAATDEMEARNASVLGVTLESKGQRLVRQIDREGWALAMTELHGPDHMIDFMV